VGDHWLKVLKEMVFGEMRMVEGRKREETRGRERDLERLITLLLGAQACERALLPIVYCARPVLSSVEV
jgi:hypothetical protein